MLKTKNSPRNISTINPVTMDNEHCKCDSQQRDHYSEGNPKAAVHVAVRPSVLATVKEHKGVHVLYVYCGMPKAHVEQK